MEKPTLEDVEKYIKEQGYYDVNPEKFWNFYESIGWLVGKKPMKNWQCAVVTWTHTTKLSRLLHKTKECSCGCGRKPMTVIDGKPYASERCLKKSQNQLNVPTVSMRNLTQDLFKKTETPRQDFQTQKLRLLGKL